MAEIRTYVTTGAKGKTVTRRYSELADGRIRVDYRDSKNVLVASEIMSRTEARNRTKEIAAAVGRTELLPVPHNVI